MREYTLTILLLLTLYTPIYAEATLSERVTKLETWRESHQEALELETSELRRRLDALNGEAERLRQMQATYLPRETYDIDHLRYRADIEELKGFRNNLIGQMAIISAIVSMLAFVLLRHFFK